MTAAKDEMAACMLGSLARLLAVQGPVTLGLMVLGRWFAGVLGLEPMQVGIFRAALVAAALHVLTQGYALAALLACGWAYLRLEQTLRDLEFLTFASQPMAPAAEPVAVAGRTGA